MRSWQSVVFEKFLLLRGTRKKFQDLALMDEFIESKLDEAPYELDEKFRQQHNIHKSEIDIHALYDELVDNYEATFIFMGDSAGGGLALAFAQDVKRLNKNQPEHIVLHSPWVDVSGEDPMYQELEKIDPMLGVVGAQQLGRMWANELDIKDYKVSPLHGESELLLVDARMLLKRAKEEGVEIYYFEYPKMNHVFQVFPIPEAKKALKTVVQIVTR